MRSAAILTDKGTEGIVTFVRLGFRNFHEALHLTDFYKSNKKAERGIALWFRPWRSHGGSPSIQNLDWLLSRPCRTISSISWALAPPSCLRYQTVSQSAINSPPTHRIPHVGQPIRLPRWEVEKEETISLCVLLGPRDGGGQRTLMEVPLFELTGLSELLASGSANSSKFLFPITTVDGRREDDISTERGEGMDEREREREEKLSLMHEKMRNELPRFFLKSHDYSMYSPDVEFINALINTKTRGRVLYQLSLSLWKLLCACYFADVRLKVLKLSKHSEDGTVRARWQVNGLPFHLLLLRFYRKDKRSLYRTYDAYSTFYLGPDGLVHCHRVDKVMPAQPPVLPRVTSVLAGVLVALGLQEHRPALNLLPFLLSSFRIGLGRQ
ncbi:hypothetical protein AAFF_G00249820 [Aldrovandia affinis]|uniref:Uncharacterized protein n=1 Tax=Aldrovandia affinis TaxID=143900 RepID=A0AAD7RCU9_9TELE|nr:hypothetical protein AAFF_G00249820 [Aldrovandia affinis]